MFLLIDKIKKKLGLMPHPEGGYFVETYRAVDENSSIMTQSKIEEMATLIYYLLTTENEKSSFSAFHILKNRDEIWIHNSGINIKIYILDPNTGELKTHVLGGIENDGMPQVKIPANHPFAAELIISENSFEKKEFYALVSCMVTPGFVYDCFTLCEPEQLLNKYSKHHEIIRRLGRSIPVAAVP